MEIQRSFVAGSSTGSLLPHELIVIFGPHGGAARMLDLVARLSLAGPLYILDCGNQSDMYRIAKALRFLTKDPVAMLKNICLSRAFTCYQVVALLEKLPTGLHTPIFVLDLLSTFMDESVQITESRLLFADALQQLLRISYFAPVVVSAKPLLAISSPRLTLLQDLKESAFQVWEEDAVPLPAQNTQIPLFADL